MEMKVRNAITSYIVISVFALLAGCSRGTPGINQGQHIAGNQTPGINQGQPGAGIQPPGQPPIDPSRPSTTLGAPQIDWGDLTDYFVVRSTPQRVKQRRRDPVGQSYEFDALT